MERAEKGGMWCEKTTEYSFWGGDKKGIKKQTGSGSCTRQPMAQVVPAGKKTGGYSRPRRRCEPSVETTGISGQ